MDVRISVAVNEATWRRLRDLAEQKRTRGRASVADILRDAIRLLLAQHTATARTP